MRKVTERVVELSDKKELVTAEDLPYIIADVLRYDQVENPVRILNYSLSLAQGLHPAATLKIEINGCEYEQTSVGDGQYDAFMRALRQIYKHQLGREFPMLRNYTVSIPPGDEPMPSCRRSSRGRRAARSSRPAGWMPTKPKPPSRRRSKC